MSPATTARVSPSPGTTTAAPPLSATALVTAAGVSSLSTHTTIAPAIASVKEPAGSHVGFPSSVASITGSSAVPAEVLAPSMIVPSPRVSVPRNSRSSDAAATVVTHGVAPGLLIEAASGPPLPAGADTKMPDALAYMKARSSMPRLAAPDVTA